MFSNIRQHYQVMRDHSKVSKKHFWMIQSAQNEVFGHYLEFGLSDQVDIAYLELNLLNKLLGRVINYVQEA